MGYKRLYIFVEGADDARFFGDAVKPKFEEKYNWVEIISYANMKKEKVKNFLKSIKAMSDSSYLFIADINDAQ